jgi:hypothetical protein
VIYLHQVAILARVVAYFVATAGHSAAVAAASTASTAAPHYAFVEQPSVQILVAAPG